MEKPQTWFTSPKCVLTHLTRESLQMCLFFGYLLLRSSIKSVIIEVRAMIVIPINA